jgi:hypothetical protein
MTEHTIGPDTPLSRLRALAQAQRRDNSPLPAPLAEAERRHAYAREKGWDLSDVVVTKEGQIVLKEDARAYTAVSRVTTQIFAARMEEDEAERVARHLPAATRKLGNGWAYPVTNEFGDAFELFVCWDRYTRCFRVRLLAPDLEALGEVHRHHLYADGHLCLSPNVGGGQRRINNAYAESVQWCNGIGAVLRGHAWPWGE